MEAHAELVARADARLVVFPEMSLTGYDMSAPAILLPQLGPLVAVCDRVGALALVGAPIREAGATYIAMISVGDGTAVVAYRKRWLGAGETHRFSPGDPATVLVVDGWRVGLGICKDTGTVAHVREISRLGVDLYVAGLVHHPDELAEQDRRGLWLVDSCRAYVAFASSAGPTGPGYKQAAGHSTIWAPGGRVLAQAGPGVQASVSARLSR